MLTPRRRGGLDLVASAIASQVAANNAGSKEFRTSIVKLHGFRVKIVLGSGCVIEIARPTQTLT